MFAEKVKSIPDLKLVATFHPDKDNAFGSNLFTFYQKGKFTYVRRDNFKYGNTVDVTYYRSRYSGPLQFVDYSCDVNGLSFTS